MNKLLLTHMNELIVEMSDYILERSFERAMGGSPPPTCFFMVMKGTDLELPSYAPTVYVSSLVF